LCNSIVAFKLFVCLLYLNIIFWGGGVVDRWDGVVVFCGDGVVVGVGMVLWLVVLWGWYAGLYNMVGFGLGWVAK